jgi:hypothetical protein
VVGPQSRAPVTLPADVIGRTARKSADFRVILASVGGISMVQN